MNVYPVDLGKVDDLVHLVEKVDDLVYLGGLVSVAGLGEPEEKEGVEKKVVVRVFVMLN